MPTCGATSVGLVFYRWFRPYHRDEVGKFKSGLSNRRKRLVRFMVVCVEYDRSNRVCIRRTGTRHARAAAQGGNFSVGGGQALLSPRWL